MDATWHSALGNQYDLSDGLPSFDGGMRGGGLSEWVCPTDHRPQLARFGQIDQLAHDLRGVRIGVAAAAPADQAQVLHPERPELHHARAGERVGAKTHQPSALGRSAAACPADRFCWPTLRPHYQGAKQTLRRRIALAAAAAFAVLAACDGRPPAEASARISPAATVEQPSVQPPAAKALTTAPTADSAPTPSPASLVRQCSNGVAVPDSQKLPGLVQDCVVLLAVRDTLGGKTPLNWDPDRFIDDWYGVVVGGWPWRVVGLDLTSYRLTGVIPPGLAALTDLRVLHLGNNKLTGSIPADLGTLVNLKELSLGHNRLTGLIPPELGELANLELLALCCNGLTGAIPPELGGLAKLEQLYLWDNQLTGAIPPELGALRSLTRLSLEGNRLTGRIPAELGGLANLKLLDFCCNELTGVIPRELGALVELEGLYLWGNQLSGQIPPELAALTRLEELNLGNNQLVGTIPRDLSALTKLQRLNLSVNALTGAIPLELSALSDLQHLVLASNQLTGPIPSWLGSFPELRVVDLHDNRFTGRAPPELDRLADLQVLNLRGNQLTGEIPQR